MVKGSSRFELQEEDTLPEKERVIQNEVSLFDNIGRLKRIVVLLGCCSWMR